MAHYGSGRRIVNRFSLLAALTLANLATIGPAHGAEPTPAGTDVEQRVLEAVNEVRRRGGLDALAADARLARIARDYSCVMARRNFFAHESPAGKTMADRVKEADVRYAAVAENLARIEAPTRSSARCPGG